MDNFQKTYGNFQKTIFQDEDENIGQYANRLLD